ncbi:signal recognition particle-docking protein FtsY, partial [Lysobacter sp. D1-1-M9]
MASFFRKKKPEKPTSRYNIEELAAAFPTARRDEPPAPTPEPERKPEQTEPMAPPREEQAHRAADESTAREPVPAEVIAAALETQPVAAPPQ